MRSLNPDHLRALAEVVAQGSFTRAAKRLHLAQPTISLQIRELEARVGVRLVDRLGKRAFATAAGVELVERAHRIEREVDDAIDAMRRRRDGGRARIRIGTGGSILAHLMPPVLRAVRRNHPHIEIVVMTGTTDEMAARVARNDLDIALVTLPVVERAVTVVLVRSDPMVAVLPPSERDAPATLDAATLARYPLIFDSTGAAMHQIARGWFRAAGVEPRAAMELGHAAMRNLISAGLGASILPIEAVLSDASNAPVVLRPLEPALTRTLAIIHHCDKGDDPAFVQVRDALLAIRDRRLALPGILGARAAGAGGKAGRPSRAPAGVGRGSPPTARRRPRQRS
jgi:DNA-binding transcriptional LysR family regulator